MLKHGSLVEYGRATSRCDGCGSMDYRSQMVQRGRKWYHRDHEPPSEEPSYVSRVISDIKNAVNKGALRHKW